MKQNEPVDPIKSPIYNLHQESQEWLSELAFWRDEVAFFYHLFQSHAEEFSTDKPTAKETETKKQLLHFSSNTIDQLKMEVDAHEQFLAKLMRQASAEDHLYRMRHEVLEKKFKETENAFRVLKQAIFKMVAKHTKDFVK